MKKSNERDDITFTCDQKYDQMGYKNMLACEY